ncbi:hypothetical protein [Abyssisolibacter fermentans]|uniref:hypothetical protein n=1 Tax=Abyssisolibacter fermentans TaxID=1766203 RepID=UPI000836A5F3|nr:hypothetical protein [Abyssisolibacter fermentans]
MNLLNKFKALPKRDIGLTVLIIFIILLLILGCKTFIYGSYVSTNAVGISQIKLENNELIVAGNIADSASGFSGYKYRIDDEKLYLKLRYSLVNDLNPSGHFSIKIVDDDLKDVKKVFFQGGKTEDIKLLLSR